MKTYLDCLPCFVRQALQAARFVTNDTAIHEQVIRHVLHVLAESSMEQSPPVTGQMIHRWVRETVGSHDPYHAVKCRFNQLALEMLPALADEVARASDPLEMASRISIAGNVMDHGSCGTLTEDDIRYSFNRVLTEPLTGDLESFRQAVAGAHRILFLTDNAGEIVFDRLLIEHLRPDRVTVAVRGGPVRDDATLDDARMAGLTDLVEVIDNGSDAPGTVLSECSESFCRRFAEADMIIAKGGGNFETLSDVDHNIFFLLKIKCPIAVAHAGLELGTHALVWSKRMHAAEGRNHA